MLEVLKAAFVMQLFYAFAVTIFLHGLPADIIADSQFSWSDTYFEASGASSTATSMRSQMEDTIEKERKAPFINTVTLIFYSGNLFVDLLMNFVLALPSMVVLLINAFFFLFNVDSFIALQMKLIIEGILVFAYFGGLISILLNFRSGGVRVA